jgi:hypothetical protein
MKRKFQKLKKWASEKEDITVEIDTSYYIYAKTKKEDRIVNGVAGTDGYIILYADKENIDWNFLTSMLIHEIGHVILFQEEKLRHTEKEAWVCGIQSVPKDCIPKNIREHVITCLKSYDYKKFGWIDRILP